VIYYGYYADLAPGAVEELVSSARVCRLVTLGEGVPHLGLYPFTGDPSGFALHLQREDEQIADLRARPRCVLEVDEVLATIPSHWIDPEHAVFATAYHKTAMFECSAELVETPAGVAEIQRGFMRRYQPEGGYRPIAANDPLYAGLIGMLVGVRLVVERAKIKFKLGQNRDPELRARIVARLRERGAPLDLRTADELEATLRLGSTRDDRP